jgi:hypothetical protein
MSTPQIPDIVITITPELSGDSDLSNQAPNDDDNDNNGDGDNS